jgi:hypothetical protein
MNKKFVILNAKTYSSMLCYILVKTVLDIPENSTSTSLHDRKYGHILWDQVPNQGFVRIIGRNLKTYDSIFLGVIKASGIPRESGSYPHSEPHCR